MPFRTIIVSSHSKLEYSLNYLVYRTADETKRILLDEVHTLIVESTAVSITSSLLAELTERKIKVIFCDAKKNPSSELIPYYNSHNSFKKIQEQVNWNNRIKDLVWQQIVIKKIENQAKLQSKIGNQEIYDKLIGYSQEVEPGDITNREGHAAKVYFNNMFYKGFTRDDSSSFNAYLNYGYTILLSQFNRVVVSHGYLTQLGIHHKNEYNMFNFSCDLIEPFRFLVDEKALQIKEEDNFKEELTNLLGIEVSVEGKNYTLSNAINVYVQSVINALNTGDISSIVFLDYAI